MIDQSFEWVFTASLIAIIGVSTFAEYFFGMAYMLFLQAKQKKYIISVVQICTYILSTISVVLLAKNGASIHIIKLVSGVIFILRPLILNLYVRKKYNLDLSNNASNYKLEKKWDGLAQHIAYVIHTKTDITVLTLFTTLAEVSVYSVYYLVVKGIKSIIGAFSGGIDATFGDMIAKNETTLLNKTFSIYELLFTITNTIAFTAGMILITPFIAVYTKGVVDANYIRPLFGALIVISEFIYEIRQPYSVIILAAGHFKETRKGAWVECLSNIIISVILVNWLGIIGVAIGTIVAMTIRTIEFMYHANRYILHRTVWKSVKKILVAITVAIITILICNYLPYRDNTNYLNWGINALMVLLAAGATTLGANAIIFRGELASAKSILIKLFRRSKSASKSNK